MLPFLTSRSTLAISFQPDTVVAHFWPFTVPGIARGAMGIKWRSYRLRVATRRRASGFRDWLDDFSCQQGRLGPSRGRAADPGWQFADHG